MAQLSKLSYLMKKLDNYSNLPDKTVQFNVKLRLLVEPMKAKQLFLTFLLKLILYFSDFS